MAGGKWNNPIAYSSLPSTLITWIPEKKCLNWLLRWRVHPVSGFAISSPKGVELKSSSVETSSSSLHQLQSWRVHPLRLHLHHFISCRADEFILWDFIFITLSVAELTSSSFETSSSSLHQLQSWRLHPWLHHFIITSSMKWCWAVPYCKPRYQGSFL